MDDNLYFGPFFSRRKTKHCISAESDFLSKHGSMSISAQRGMLSRDLMHPIEQMFEGSGSRHTMYNTMYALDMTKTTYIRNVCLTVMKTI